MAEENGDSLIIPDKSESGGSVSSNNGSRVFLHDQRVSFSSGDDVNNSRRNSTGKPSPVNGNQKIVPHYLRASTGSCHDFCKYGRKEASEVKKGFPLWRRTLRALSDKQKSVVITVQGERRRSMASKHTTSTDCKSPDPPEIIKREVSTSKELEVSSKPDLSTGKKMLKTEKKINTSSDKHSPPVRPQLMKESKKTNSASSEKHSPSVEQQLMKQSKKKMTTSFEKKSPSVQPKLKKQSTKKMNTVSEKLLPSLEPPLIKQSSSSHPLEPGKKKQNAEKGIKVMPKKISPSPQPQPITAKASSPSSQSTGGINGRVRRQDSIGTSKITVVSGSYARKAVIPPTNSVSARRSANGTISSNAGKTRGSKLMSSPLSRNRTQEAEMEESNPEKVPEKTLHVVETETKNSDVIPSLPSQPPSSSMPSHEEEDDSEEEEEDEDEEEEEEEEENGNSSGKAEDLLSEKKTTANTNRIKAVEENRRKNLRRGTVVPESKDPTAVKLKFRRGKVVDVRSENNGPRRLRFRRARVMDGNQDNKSETRRKTFKKNGDGGDGKDTNTSDKKVVLRHQDTQGKKDAQGLFNNVIEETASKLVVSRKSKVKALVGAFETVISLQETKPSS